MWDLVVLAGIGLTMLGLAIWFFKDVQGDAEDLGAGGERIDNLEKDLKDERDKSKRLAKAPLTGLARMRAKRKRLRKLARR